MVILGLGSNLGDKLANLRRAISEIEKLPQIRVQQISPVYLSNALLPENAPKDWDMPYLNLAIRCETSLDPFDLLKQLKNIEWSIGRKPEARHWGPRIMDIDILAWEDRTIQTDVLTVPHENLQARPFALWPLADIAPLWSFPLEGQNKGKTAAQMVEGWGSRFSGDAPSQTRQLYQRIDQPQLVGILNITPDSFSDGGHFLNPEAAFNQVLTLLNTGAEIIDIGAESTRPGATPLTPEEEWARLQPLLEMIQAKQSTFFIPPKISLDTRHVAVAEKALPYGIHWINDVSGLDDPRMQQLIAAAGIECVIMHHLSIPEKKEERLDRAQDPTSLVYAWGEKRIQALEKIGIPKEKIIFDPGIGFGKSAEQSLILIKNAAVFKDLGTRILIGHSRKSFLSLFSNLPFAERDIETLAITLHLADQSIDYVRVHDVFTCSRGLKVSKAF